MKHLSPPGAKGNTPILGLQCGPSWAIEQMAGEAFEKLQQEALEFKHAWEELYQERSGNSLAVQWLGLRTSTAGGQDSIPGRETKILQAAGHGQK